MKDLQNPPRFAPLQDLDRSIASLTRVIESLQGEVACIAQAGEAAVPGSVAGSVAENSCLCQNDHVAAGGQFAPSIASEVNELLNVMSCNTESPLNSPGVSVMTGESRGKIDRAGEQAAVLAGWLLAFSRRQARQFRTMDLNTMIRGLRSHLTAILPQEVELQLSLEPVLDKVEGDEAALQEALIHLVVNARDAMPEGGTLTIETARVRQLRQGEPDSARRTYALLRVTDTGVGMDAATQDCIFEPLYDGKLEAPAAGLGLSAVHGIVKQSGGWISVYSEKGTGTSFEIFLPCTPEPIAA
jgi:signal transduction histidine kinase